MQRLDAGYLYDLGDAVRSIRAFRLKDVPSYEIWQPLMDCRQKLALFLYNSVYTGSLRPVLQLPANLFIDEIDNLITRILNEALESVSSLDQTALQSAYERFEPVLSAELSSQVTFLVLPKGAYDIVKLVDQGAELFPPSLKLKAPESIKDVEEGAKALAFELWSASAFHFHRANEALLRRYFDLHCGCENRPDPCTMGTMLRCMEQKGKGDGQVIVALRNITKFHRNPNSHPGEFIEDSEQAFSLVAALRAAMAYMLAELPFVTFDGATNPSQITRSDAPPLIAPKAEV